MTIPFLDIFKKAKARFTQSSEPAVAGVLPRALPLEKPTSERLSKTVMPNTTRVASAPDLFKAAADSAPNIKLPMPRSAKLPPSVALALQPKVERAISLQLGDILDQLPAGFVKPTEQFDPAQPILLKASEIEKGMATGKPVVSLVTIYEQVPEIFLRNVPPDDVTQIGLPFGKVMDQFQNMQLRPDQEEEHEVPQMDTPILQAALEDTERFGTPMPAIQTSVNPPVRVEPATARTLSSAEPEPAVQERGASVPAKGIPLNISSSPIAPAPSLAAPKGSTPTRIPFHLPSNGTDGSASETVPASSGPSVPTSTPPATNPGRIPFKVSAPCEDIKPKPILVPGTGATQKREVDAAAIPTARASGEAKISLGLHAVLNNMPAFQLSGSAGAVPTDVRIDLPLSLVESQLASGRISVPAKVFRDAVAEEHRALVAVDDAQSPVLLPLQEVLKNLPSTVLKMRDDQEEGDVAGEFETPFSIKAAEDAKRFNTAPAVAKKEPEAPVTKQEVPVAEKTEPMTRAAEVSVEKKSEVPAPLEAKAVSAPEASAPLAMDEVAKEKRAAPPAERLEANTNAKDVVTKAAALPGIAGCSITFEDGLSLAGNLPDDVQVGGLCAMAPSVLQKINRHTADTKLGPLQSMTLHCRESQMSFFMKGSVCLTVLHPGGNLTPATHNKLAEMAKELSRTYTQPETVHVDH